jgi:hypothetical protein
MPIRKIHQSKLEATRTSFHLNQLLSEGIDIGMDPEPGATPEACPLKVSNSDIGEIYALPNDNTIYCLPLRIVPHACSILDDCHIRSAWDPFSIELPHLTERNGRYHHGPVNLRTNEVLNDIFGERLHRGAIREGMILACGFMPVPDEVGDTKVSVEITLVDTLERKITAEIRCLVKDNRKAEPALSLPRQSRLPKSLQE